MIRCMVPVESPVHNATPAVDGGLVQAVLAGLGCDTTVGCCTRKGMEQTCGVSSSMQELEGTGFIAHTSALKPIRLARYEACDPSS